jgi:hypothetical protein
LELGQHLTKLVVGGDEGVDSLRLASRPDCRGLASKLHAPAIKFVHSIEIGVKLGDELIPLVAVALVADRRLQAGGLENQRLISPFARFVTGAKLFVEHLHADCRREHSAQLHCGRGNKFLKD